MSVFESLREAAAMPGPMAELAQELLTIQDNFEKGDLTKEEFDFLVNEVAEIKAAQALATDEQACRFIVSCATLLIQAV